MTTSFFRRWRLSAKDALLVAVFVLATVHCVRSIFLVNISYISLRGYIAGTEKMPFQGRTAMVPLMRWATGNHTMIAVAGYLDDNLRYAIPNPAEDVTPEKLACMLAGLVAMLVAVGFLLDWGRARLGRYWWLPAALFLAVLYASYAARSDAQFWYPYDLSHFAIFGMAAVFVLNGAYLPAFCLFLVDVPVRETSIFLLPVTIATAYARQRPKAMWWGVAMLAVWVPVRIVVLHRFAHNPSDTGIHWLNMRKALVNPLRWPQTASAFGFLLVPFCLGFKRLTREERYFVAGAVPCLVMTGLYGVWYESRIWDEWVMPFAVLLSVQAVRSWTSGLPNETTSESLDSAALRSA